MALSIVKQEPKKGSTKADAIAFVGRLIANYDDWHGIEDDAYRAAVVREFTEHFAAYSPEVVHQAISTHIRKSRKFPQVSDLLEIIQHALPAPGRTDWRKEERKGPSESYKRWLAQNEAIRAEMRSKASTIPPLTQEDVDSLVSATGRE